MKPLAQKIKALIEKKGPIAFSEYMALCLFDPDYGYYSCLEEIGAKGDFVTAPELGPYFANALARFIAPQIQAFSNPVIVELGGGTGQMAFDLLCALKESNNLPERYLIIDKSLSLQLKQKSKLRELGAEIFAKIEWHEELKESNLQGVLIANEFFDALPVERFIVSEAGPKHLGVDWQGQFVEVELAKSLRAPQEDLPIGYCSEICEGLQEIVKPILQGFSKGLALVVDYGDIREHYYHPMRKNGTITAYQNHQIVSVFENPGEADVTAHVDFTHLAECFIACGWSIDFLKPQNQFLLEQNILPKEGIGFDNYQLKRLLDPRLMGALFKVMVAHLN